MIDSHCHLDFEAFGPDRAQVLARAREAGVTCFICIGSGKDTVSARQAVALAGVEHDVFAAVGVHPHDVARMSEADWTELDGLAREARVVGIGETGLDYHYNHSPADTQQQAFERFVALARAVKRPVISHVRDAHDDAVDILTRAGAAEVGGVIHCFTGGVAEARRYLDLGHHLSFSGILTFKNAQPIRDAAAFAPLDRVLVETDAPYLAPIPHRGKRNEPAFMRETLRVLAEVRGADVGEVEAATAANTRRLFRLPFPEVWPH
jgi:TatD DNase family protein